MKLTKTFILVLLYLFPVNKIKILRLQLFR